MCSGNEDQQWESELMLKDPRWSVSKGVKDDSNVGKISLTPLIIRHNQSNKMSTFENNLNVLLLSAQ